MAAVSPSPSQAAPGFDHLPVLAQQVLEAFAEPAGSLALPSDPSGSPPLLIDCTLGGGGLAILDTGEEPRDVVHPRHCSG